MEVDEEMMIESGFMHKKVPDFGFYNDFEDDFDEDGFTL